MLLKIPPGFNYFSDFLTAKEEIILIQHFKKIKWEKVKMHGIVAKRRVVHFGYDYHYSKKAIKKTKPIPKYLTQFITRAAELVGIDKEQFVEVLITEYASGAGIGWHRDAKIFGDLVFGISLLHACTLKLRAINQDGEVYKIILEPRSAYVISGEARNEWYHSINPVKQLRYSITLRTLKSV